MLLVKIVWAKTYYIVFRVFVGIRLRMFLSKYIHFPDVTRCFINLFYPFKIVNWVLVSGWRKKFVSNVQKCMVIFSSILGCHHESMLNVMYVVLYIFSISNVLSSQILIRLYLIHSFSSFLYTYTCPRIVSENKYSIIRKAKNISVNV